MMSRGPMPSVASHSYSVADLVHLSERGAVNAMLLFNEFDHCASRRLRSATSLTRWNKWLGVTALFAAATSSVSFYYVYAHLHRVWRMRHPRLVHRYRLSGLVSGFVSFSIVLFLVSPVGLSQRYERGLQEAQHLDRCAMCALLAHQNYSTLSVWAAERAQQWQGAPVARVFRDGGSVSAPSSSFSCIDTMTEPMDAFSISEPTMNLKGAAWDYVAIPTTATDDDSLLTSACGDGWNGCQKDKIWKCDRNASDDLLWSVYEACQQHMTELEAELSAGTSA